MGLAPYARQAGNDARNDAKKDDFDFYPIPLTSFPLLNNSCDSGLASGVIFSGQASDATTGDALSCCGRYGLLNTDHQGIAGLWPDGSLLFAVNSRIGGKRCTAIGAFDPKGKPVAPTKAQKDILSKYVPKDSRPIVMDAKSSGALGIKTNGTNPNGGVYIGKNQIIYEFGGSLAIGQQRSIVANGSVTTDWAGKATGRAIDLTLKDGGNSIGASLQQNGKQLVRQVNAKAGDWTMMGKLATSPGQRTREIDLGYHPNDKITVTAYWKPDNKPPTSAPRPTVQQLINPPTMPDYSNFGIKLEIRWP